MNKEKELEKCMICTVVIRYLRHEFKFSAIIDFLVPLSIQKKYVLITESLDFEMLILLIPCFITTVIMKKKSLVKLKVVETIKYKVIEIIKTKLKM